MRNSDTGPSPPGAGPAPVIIVGHNSDTGLRQELLSMPAAGSEQFGAEPGRSYCRHE